MPFESLDILFYYLLNDSSCLSKFLLEEKKGPYQEITPLMSIPLFMK